jgi:flagella basal body P-ring formation protein FlgA
LTQYLLKSTAGVLVKVRDIKPGDQIEGAQGLPLTAADVQHFEEQETRA